MKRKPRHELVDITKMSIEDICRKMNIQSNLLDLQSNKEERVKQALQSLASVTRLGQRKDSLYALVGYFVLEVKTLDEIEFFFQAIEQACSIELTYFILERLTKNKKASRRRLLVKDILSHLGLVLRRSPEHADLFREVVESSAWGEKQKDKFLWKIDEAVNRRVEKELEPGGLVVEHSRLIGWSFKL